jgi:predicted RNA-binding Zn-ribbon protein involved in translation (DUF1610 family)
MPLKDALFQLDIKLEFLPVTERVQFGLIPKNDVKKLCKAFFKDGKLKEYLHALNNNKHPLLSINPNIITIYRQEHSNSAKRTLISGFPDYLHNPNRFLSDFVCPQCGYGIVAKPNFDLFVENITQTQKCDFCGFNVPFRTQIRYKHEVYLDDI